MRLDLIAAELEPTHALLEGRFAQTIVALSSGAQVAVRTTGAAQADAPTIVLLHGIGSGAASWLSVAIELGARARVLAWDAPGYGASTPLTIAQPSAADYARRLHEVLAALQIDSCVLVGHSLGALMACAFAADAGRHIVQGLVLISPARGYGGADRAELGKMVLESRLGALRNLGIDGIAAEAPKRMLSAHASSSARAWVQRNAAQLNPAGYAQAVQMLCGSEILDHAPLPMPVDVLCGEADQITTPDSCREIAARFGASFDVVPLAGHASPVEQPVPVALRIASAVSLSLGEEQE
jgi:pimeloyl-ACP methyl ester carboxylesterase